MSGLKTYGFVGLTVCIAALTPAPAAAQTLDDAGLWFAAFTNGEADFSDDTSTDWLYWFDGHYRLRDDAEGFNQSIVRPGVGRRVGEDQALWVGYAWIRTQPIARGGLDFPPEETDEHRYWQQWTWSPSAGPYRFLHRSRFEQRTLEGSNDVALRWRQLARGQKILTAGCAHRPEWSLIAWDEIFFHLNDADWGPRAGLDQNRTFFGVGYKPTADAPVRTEIGYLNQFINSQGGEDGMNHILSVNFFF
jgi:hypothetical protein